MTEWHGNGITDPLGDLLLGWYCFVVRGEAVGVGECLDACRFTRSDQSTFDRMDVATSAWGHESSGDRGRWLVSMESPIDGCVRGPVFVAIRSFAECQIVCFVVELGVDLKYLRNEFYL